MHHILLHCTETRVLWDFPFCDPTGDVEICAGDASELERCFCQQRQEEGMASGSCMHVLDSMEIELSSIPG